MFIVLEQNVDFLFIYVHFYIFCLSFVLLIIEVLHQCRSVCNPFFSNLFPPTFPLSQRIYQSVQSFQQDTFRLPCIRLLRKFTYSIRSIRRRFMDYQLGADIFNIEEVYLIQTSSLYWGIELDDSPWRSGFFDLQVIDGKSPHSCCGAVAESKPDPPDSRWPMVSLAMPAEYDSVVAASPPVFSHSPPTPGGGPGGFLANYGHFRFEADPWQHHHFNYNNYRHVNSWVPVTRRQENYRRPPPPSLPLTIPQSTKASPRRPCLVVRPEEATSPESSPDEPTSPTRLKKKVVFADDRGLSLTQVRVMREPSDCPPLWTLEFLAQVTRGVAAAAAAASSDGNVWETSFSQPAADYLAFRRRIDSSFVSLENAVVMVGNSSEDTSATLVGTVKVRNLAFQKEVSIRYSFDKWVTHGDVECSFVPSSPLIAPPALYDTFSFSLKLPSNARRLEFCVRFRCEGSEHWDNNEGSNYVVVRPPAVADTGAASAVAAAASIAAASSLARHAQRKFDDAVHAKVSTWSEFASWNHLVNDAPYW